MRQGLNGNQLPESEADYTELLQTGQLRYTACCFGNHPHYGRTHTSLGWAETQISGSCEECFDDMLNEKDELP